MAIDNELSSEIAEALLTGEEKDTRKLNAVRETVMKVHCTLQKLAEDSQRRRMASKKREESDRTHT
jgi:hypothetical protein